MLPSPAKRAWTMNPRPEWVVTVRMTGPPDFWAERGYDYYLGH